MLYVYIGCLTFGLIYSVVSALLGSHGFDHGAGDAGGAHGISLDSHDGSIDSADVPSPFNPLVMASAIVSLGFAGAI